MLNFSHLGVSLLIQVTANLTPAGLETHKSCAEIHLTIHDHDNIIKVFGFHLSEPKRTFCLIMEVALGSLRDIIGTSPKNPALKEQLISCMTLREAMGQVFHGVAYIHSKKDMEKNKISHRDLKPENVLIVQRHRDDSLVPKISDFDSVKQMDAEALAAMTTGRPIFTPLYLDPCLRKKKQDPEKRKQVTVDDYQMHDVFGAAATAYEVIGSGEHLYQGEIEEATIFNMWRNNRDMLTEASIDELGKNLFWTMTQSEPELRVTMDQAKACPYFQDASVHIQLLFAVNEAIIEISKSKLPKDVIAKLNATFYALFQVKWQDQDWPFIIGEVLKGSKYTDTLDSFFRYCRNLIAHTGQHITILETKFGKVPTGVELLEMILEKVPRTLIHLYWFAKCYLPQLSSLTNHFPEQCAKAYDNLLSHLSGKVVGGVEALCQDVCPSLAGAAKVPVIPSKTAGSAVEDHEDCINFFVEKVRDVVAETEPDFKDLKRDVQQWEKREKSIQSTIENMNKSKDPQTLAKIDEKLEELEDVRKRLKVKWFLEYRKLICDKDVFETYGGKLE